MSDEQKQGDGRSLVDFSEAFISINKDMLHDTGADAVMIVAVKAGQIVICPAVTGFNAMADLLERMPFINEHLEGLAREMVAESEQPIDGKVH